MKYWDKHTVYLFLFTGSVLGLIYVGFTGYMQATGASPLWSGCVIKEATGLACPSCGSTRTVLELLRGEISMIIHGNPLGLIILPALFVIPAWIIYDTLTARSGLFNTLNRFITALKNNLILSGTLVLLIVLNWIWNIIKGL